MNTSRFTRKPAVRGNYGRYVMRFLLSVALAFPWCLTTPTRANDMGYAQHPTLPFEGGCVPVTFSTSITRQPESVVVIPHDWYANEVVSATDVINPQNALGGPDVGWAILTDTSVLTLSFSSPFLSGVSLYVQHPVESTCNWIWLYTRYYADLAQTPILTTTRAGFMAPGEEGVIGDGLSVKIAPHQYAVITINTLILLDSVHYVIPAKHYWLPVIMRNSS